MRNIFTKIALSVALTLALVFVFSCSGGDNSGGEPKCGGVVYDTDIYRCEAGELIGKCKGVDYYPAYQQCVGGVVEDGSPSSSSGGGGSSSISSGSLSSSSIAGVSSSSSVKSSSSVVVSTSGTFTDDRDSKVYKLIKIGSQTWMAENLAYDAPNSKLAIYGNGRFYDWETAKTICPSGWHLPSKEKWERDNKQPNKKINLTLKRDVVFPLALEIILCLELERMSPLQNGLGCLPYWFVALRPSKSFHI